MPAIFAILGYLAIYYAAEPVFDLGSAALSMLTAESTPNFDPELEDIYRPNAPKPTVDPAYTGNVDITTPAPELPDRSTEPGMSDEPSVTPDPDSTGSPETTQKPDKTPKPAATPLPSSHYPDGYQIPFSTSMLPKVGQRYGNLYSTDFGLNAPVYWGDSKKILRHGAGQSVYSFQPGFGRTILISGHNTSYFRCFKRAEVGDIIVFDTNYETYTYRVYRVQVINETVLENMMNDTYFLQEKETLILYTCYPFHAIGGRKTDRLVLFCEKIDGADVKWR